MPYEAESRLAPEFVPLDRLENLRLMPPIGGHIRALHRGDRVAAYLGNIWQPQAVT